MYRALRPKYVIPVHGEERMSAHAGLATDAGLGAARVTNGDAETRYLRTICDRTGTHGPARSIWFEPRTFE